MSESHHPLKNGKRMLEDSEKILPQLEKELTSSQGKLSDAEKKEASITEEINNKYNILDEMKNALSASQSRSTLIKAFLEQKTKGNLTGVWGRLGDLGAIDEKYNIAVSTACGALDNIVTDTIETAEECVAFLKKNNLGYATFIALDMMTKWEPYTKKMIATPEKMPRLFDLIKVKNEKILPAFYFALKDTLVAKDLEQATRVGLQGKEYYRVVTLKGELVDLSGTISGGGPVMKDRMGQSVTIDTVSLEKDIEMLNAALETLNKYAIEIRTCKQELRESISEMEKEISRLHHCVKKAKSN